MSGLDIEAIRARHLQAAGTRAYRPMCASADDVPALLAEVERLTTEARNAEFEVVRLRGESAEEKHVVADGVEVIAVHLAEIERLRAELLEEQTVHAKTMDNFESMSESALEFRTHQLDRYARLDAEHERLKSRAADLKADNARLSGEVFIVEQERDQARAEVEKLREWNDEIKAERDDLAQRCLTYEAELRDARAALADALQVIADLRGGS